MLWSVFVVCCLLQVSMSCVEMLWRSMAALWPICQWLVCSSVEASPVWPTGRWHIQLMLLNLHFSQMNWSVQSVNITASWTVRASCTVMREVGEGSSAASLLACCVLFQPMQQCWLWWRRVVSWLIPTCESAGVQFPTTLHRFCYMMVAAVSCVSCRYCSNRAVLLSYYQYLNYFVVNTR